MCIKVYKTDGNNGLLNRYGETINRWHRRTSKSNAFTKRQNEDHSACCMKGLCENRLKTKGDIGKLLVQYDIALVKIVIMILYIILNAKN